MRFSSFLRAVIQSGSMDVTSAVKESAKVFGFPLKEKQIEAYLLLLEAMIHLCLYQQVMASPSVMLFCQVYLIG